MHEAVAALRERLLLALAAPTGLVVAHELALAYGRPDVVAAAVELGQWRAWRKRKIEPCTAPLALATALALSKRGGRASADALVASNGGKGSRSRTRRSLATLVELGWVRRQGEMFVLRLEPGAAVLAVSGVEAKLNNWRRAVRQAQSWESYVDAAWLAFPLSYLPHVPRTPPLRRFGLIAVEGGEARIIRRPSGRRANGVRHLLIEQHLYARWLTVTRRANSGTGRGEKEPRGRVRAASRVR